MKQQYLKHKGLKFRKRGKEIEYKSVAFVVMQKNKKILRNVACVSVDLNIKKTSKDLILLITILRVNI